MKTKLTLLLSALTLSAYAGPSDSVAFAIRAAKEYAAKSEGQATVAHNDSGPSKYVPAPNGKGGVVLVRSNGPATTNIALFKSKGASNECAACCAKH